MYESLKGHNPLDEAAERGEEAPAEPEATPDPRPFPAEEVNVEPKSK